MSVLKLPVPVNLGGTGADNPTQAKINLEINFDSEIPIGSLNYFPNANGDSYLTSGLWLKCNGQVVSQATYPTLFNRIGLINPGGSIWTVRTSATTQDMTSATSTSGQTLLGGSVGGVQYSSNGVNWSFTALTGTRSSIQAITNGNNLYVLAANNYLAWSTDAIQWKSRVPLVIAARMGPKLFVAGSSGSVFTSTDAITFDAQSFGQSFNVAALAYGGSLYVAAGGGNTIMSSTDAVTWTQGNIAISMNFSTITYGNGLYVTNNGQNAYCSTDCITWVSRNTGSAASISAYAFGLGVYVGGATNGNIRTSTDTITWGAATSNTPSQIVAIDFLNNLFVSVGFNGNIVTSTDAVTWTARTSGTTSAIRCISYGAGLYVYGADGGLISTSTDCVAWTARTSNTTSTITSLAYTGSKFIGIAANSILTSTDAITWSIVTTPTLNTQPIRGLAYGNSVYTAVGNGGVAATSTDGQSWTPRTTGTTSSLLDLVYASSKFAACGQAGVLLTSTDGITWASQNSTVTATLNGINYSTKFLCGGANTLLTSTDAVTWVSNNSLANQLATYTIVDFTYANNIVVGIGQGGLIFRSDDSTNFYPQNSTTTSGYLSITSNSSNFVIGAQNVAGGVVTSPINYTYNTLTSFQLPTDANVAIVTEVPSNFKRSLYIKALIDT